jgi:hypothetical protein
MVPAVFPGECTVKVVLELTIQDEHYSFENLISVVRVIPGSAPPVAGTTFPPGTTMN